MPYLLKTEPSAYSFDDLERDHETVWDGITNPQALHFLAGMKSGDTLVLYHSGKDKAAIGTAAVVSVDAVEGRGPVVRIRAGQRLSRPRQLAEMRAESVFAGSLLLRQSRLSVVPLTDEQYAWLVGK